MGTSQAPNNCRLLDLPDELFNRCMPACDRFHHSLSACKKLFGVAVAGNHSGSLRLCLRVEANAEVQRATLERMLQAFSVLKKLQIQIGQPKVLGELLAPSSTLGPMWLVNITDISLSSSGQGRKGLIWLDNLIPQRIADACPQLQRLSLQHMGCKPQIQVQQQQQTGRRRHGRGRQQQQQQQQRRWQPAALPHLRELVLDHCTFTMQPSAVKQQLQALPSLQCLKLITGDPDAVNMFSSRVTELVWTGDKLLWDGDTQLPCMQLCRLVAHAASICLQDLQLFCKLLPSLDSLEVGRFDLKAAYSGELPALTHISIGSEQDWAGLASLQHLLQSACAVNLSHLSYRGAEMRVDLSGRKAQQAQEDLRRAASLKSQVQRVGGLKPQRGGRSMAAIFLGCVDAEGFLAQVLGGNYPPKHVQRMLHTLVFIFHDLRYLTLEGHIEVDRALLTALGQVPGLEHLEFRDRWGTSSDDEDDDEDGIEDSDNVCFFRDDVWPYMMSLLPKVQFLMFGCYSVSPRDVILLCLTATHKVEVQVESDADDWRDTMLLHALDVASQRSLVEVNWIESW